MHIWRFIFLLIRKITLVSPCITVAVRLDPQNANGEGGESNLGDLLQEAYENGQLKGRQIIEAKRLIEKRQQLCPSSPNAAQIKPPTTR